MSALPDAAKSSSEDRIKACILLMQTKQFAFFCAIKINTFEIFAAQGHFLVFFSLKKVEGNV